MNIHRFASEAHSKNSRHAAWREFLRPFGMAALVSAQQGFDAVAKGRTSPKGIALLQIASTGQELSSSAHKPDLPIAVLHQDGEAVLREATGERLIMARELVLLPRLGAASLFYPGPFRIAVLSAPAAMFGNRVAASQLSTQAVAIPNRGLASVLSSLVESVVEQIDALGASDWSTLDQSLSELVFALAMQAQEHGTESATATQAALLHRIRQGVERRLDEPELSPARVAQEEGISERYLQKLFEVSGDNFTRYLRERRLQKARHEFGNLALAHQSVSNIAYGCGFNDAAHFSRAFRERFGLSPREFRRQEIERALPLATLHGQRGWPQQALAHMRPQKTISRTAREPGGPAPERPASLTRAKGAGAATGGARHHHLAVDSSSVHWGYFSRSLKPVLEIASGDIVTIETLTQHASDDPERMIAGDIGAESVFGWTPEKKNVNRRGAGPLDASIYGRGAGEGFGVHVCTGPIYVSNAQPGDVLEVRILDIEPRPSANPKFDGRVFGSSAAAWWGYHYDELLTEPKPREVITIYEILFEDAGPFARAVYNYRWTQQTDPFGVAHATYDYPGVPVAPDSIKRRENVLDGVRVALRPHFGVIGVAPKEANLIDSVPPSYFGGNLDNWRLGKGSAIYLPVSAPGALLSVGDPHATQGDGELSGTAIECSLTGAFQIMLHKKGDLAGRPFFDLTYPLIETPAEWVLLGFTHPNYLAEFGNKSQSEVYASSSLDLAMKDAFRKMRRFLMATQGLSEDEAISLISVAVDFGITQVVDGNWGVHAIIKKQVFASEREQSQGTVKE
jgi:acetamidase/formamidase/AraC-like DNA-binding protein